MILFFLFLSSLFTAFSDIPLPFSTKIETEKKARFPSLTLRNDFAIGSYYDLSSKSIKVFECFTLDCLNKSIITVENSNREKGAQTLVGVDRGESIYTAFFDKDEGKLKLAIIFPNRTTIIMRTLAGETTPLEYVNIDMVMFGSTQPLIVFQDNLAGLQYALCLNPPYCSYSRVRILDPEHNPIWKPHVSLDQNGYLNICMERLKSSSARYFRCYDHICRNKSITFLKGIGGFECKDIDINPKTNFAGFFMGVRSTQQGVMLYSCKDLACNTYSSSIFSFAQSLLISGRYDKNGIPHIVYTEFSTNYLMGINCLDGWCSQKNAKPYVLDNSGSFRDIHILELDQEDKEVILYQENRDAKLYYFRFLDDLPPGSPIRSILFPSFSPTLKTHFPTQSPIEAPPLKKIAEFLTDFKKSLIFYIPFSAVVLILIGNCIYFSYIKKKKKKVIEEINRITQG